MVYGKMTRRAFVRGVGAAVAAPYVITSNALGGAERPAAAVGGHGERDRIIELLDRHGGNRSLVARQLGVSRTTLWRRMKQLGISSRSA